jgi:hypothetical protein
MRIVPILSLWIIYLLGGVQISAAFAPFQQAQLLNANGMIQQVP